MMHKQQVKLPNKWCKSFDSVLGHWGNLDTGPNYTLMKCH